MTKVLSEWQSVWAQCAENETRFAEFVAQNPELAQTFWQKWRDFCENDTTMAFEVAKHLNDDDVPFRQPENDPDSIEMVHENAIQSTPTTPETTMTNPTLPNARKGEVYCVDLPENALDVHITPECGLQWDETAQRISGIPTHSGDVEIRYYVQSESNFRPVYHKIYINPDPKDLWTNIPTDPNIPFYKPDNHSEMLTTTHGALLAARVRGRSHAHTGKPCDDDFAIRHHEQTGLHLMAVSDGAGSAAFSRLGSQVAVAAVADCVWQLLGSQQDNYTLAPQQTLAHQQKVLLNLTNQAAYQAMVALHQTAKANNIELKQLSCTLLFVLSLPLENGGWLHSTYGVGDGALAIWQPETQHLHFVAESDSGSYSGETRFLTADETTVAALKQRTRIHMNEHAPILFVMTDGVSDPKFETDLQLKNPQKWQDLCADLQAVWQNAQPEMALQEWLNFWSAGNHDDRTLAMFVPQAHFRQPENAVADENIADLPEKNDFRQLESPNPSPESETP